MTVLENTIINNFQKMNAGTIQKLTQHDAQNNDVGTLFCDLAPGNYPWVAQGVICMVFCLNLGAMLVKCFACCEMSTVPHVNIANTEAAPPSGTVKWFLCGASTEPQRVENTQRETYQIIDMNQAAFPRKNQQHLCNTL